MKKLLRNLVLILNILFAASLLVAYLAPIVNPSKIFLPALFGLAYPYLLLINLLFIFYFLVRLKKTFLLSLIVVLIGWNHLSNLIPIHFKKKTPPEKLEQSESLHLLSYNVRSFNLYDWAKEPKAKEEIFRMISEKDPDIICLQEFYTTPKVGCTEEYIDNKLSATPHKSVYYSFSGRHESYWGIATYSKFPILKMSRIPFSNSQNAAMYSDIKIGNDTVRVFNLHLQSIKFRERNFAFMDSLKFKYSEDQVAEFRDIGSHLKQAFILRSEQSTVISNYIKQSPYPVILMGDFNDTPVSFAYRKIKKGMKDAFRTSGKGFGSTYSGELPSFRIDFIFYSDPFQSANFERTKIKYSDHYPIETLLYLPE